MLPAADQKKIDDDLLRLGLAEYFQQLAEYAAAQQSAAPWLQLLMSGRATNKTLELT